MRKQQEKKKEILATIFHSALTDLILSKINAGRYILIQIYIYISIDIDIYIYIYIHNVYVHTRA